MNRWTTVGLLVLVSVGGAGAAPRRAERPAFKGMELYSWKPEGKGWHFSLLVGTNREKTREEITAPKSAVGSVAKLKRRLAELARGEFVSWRNLAKEAVPAHLEEELKSHCERLQVQLDRL